MKNSRLFTELFQWSKRCAGKIPVYGGKNKSDQWAEKKPAYGRIKNYVNFSKMKLERLKTVRQETNTGDVRQEM